MKLNSIADINPETYKSSYNWSDINYLDTSSITENLIENFQKFVNDKNLPSRAKRIVKENDIIYSSVRPINKHYGILKNIPNKLLVSTAFTVIRVDKEKANPDFVYEFIKQSKITKYLQNIGEDSQSSYPSINPEDLSSLDLNVPSLEKQIFIGELSKVFQKKIESNKILIKKIEEISKSLFNKWFVDFDPVLKKIKEKQFDLPKRIMDLFPNNFEESSLGKIPSGWRICKLNDLCKSISSGGTPKREKKEFWINGKINWYKTGELNDTYLLESEEKINQLGLDNSSCKLFKKNTILFAIYASPTLGNIGILNEDAACNQAAAGLIPKDYIGLGFLKYLLLFSRKKLQYDSNGAAQQNINVNILKEFEVIEPPKELTQLYSMIVEPFEKKINCLIKENNDLMKLKDEMIQKLILNEFSILED